MICPNPKCPDLLESGTPNEFREGIDYCTRCGVRLVHPESRTEPVEKMEWVDFVPVGTIADHDKFEPARCALDAAGIPNNLRVIFRGTGRGWPFVVEVDPGRADEARAILKPILDEPEGDAAPTPAVVPSRCPSCGKSLETDGEPFDACYFCGESFARR